PELYFQKVKRDEMGARITYATLYGIFFTAAYALNFTRIAICLSILHYSVEALFHLSRLLYFADKLQIVNYSFKLWNVLFVLVRLGSITLSVLTFWYGLATHQTTQFNVAEGNFNTQIIRINCLAAVCLLEAWMMWNFINFHLRRMREKAAEAAALRKKSAGGVRKKPKKTEKEDVSELPEVDQNTNKGLIHRPNKAINCLAAVCLLEAWMMWNFINFHLRRMREKAAEAAALRKKSAGGVRKKPKKTEKEDVSELPEVDQNTNKGLIHRPNKASPKVK
ncbi:unnamed protein product, partial [Oppiella nova]